MALHAATGCEATELSESCVWMRDYSDGEIAAYVASGDPLDKAGAYAIQHRGFAPVAGFEGCYASIMGLPLGHVARALAAVGVTVPVDVARACQAATVAVCCLSSGGGGWGALTSCHEFSKKLSKVAQICHFTPDLTTCDSFDWGPLTTH